MTSPSNMIKEDVGWLCSISKSELDLLISLKKLALKRASVIGHDQLADKFDLKMLRALGFILMEHLKVQIKNLPLIPGLADSAAVIDSSNLSKHKLDEMMSFEEVQQCLAFDTRKEFRKRRREKDAAVRSKRSRSAEELNEQTEWWEQNIKVEETDIMTD